MRKIRLKRMCAALVGTSMFLPIVYAGDLIQRNQTYSRPMTSGPIVRPELSQAGEVELFVRFSIPSVAEFNIDSLKRNGKIANSKTQKKQAKKISAQHEEMRGALVAMGAEELSALRVGVNGMRIKINADSISALRVMPNVRSVAPVVRHELNNAQSVPWIGTQDFWAFVGTGSGISIAVIDTGIDYQHMNFGGSGADIFPTSKVVGGYDFVGDDYDANDELPTIVPDADPLDCNGHGSHVAGTAAGLGVDGIIGAGVAKGADLYALKIFGCKGSTSFTSDAIEWAMDPNGDGDMSDHLDVINMSLGSSFGHPDDPSAIATNHAVELGIIVAISAGNSGDVPYVTGAPGVASGAISTAASIKAGDVLGIDVTGDVIDIIEAVEGAGPTQLSDGSVVGSLVQDNDNVIGCTDDGVGITVDMTGSIALISRGGCNFDEKFLNAQIAGAVGVVVYNDGADSSRVAPIVMGGNFTGITIPGVMIPSTDGLLLSSAIGGGAAASALLDESIATPTAFFDHIAGFSSRGPGHGGSTFKPDVTTPGANIVSTAAGTLNGSANFSGTSMASPHTAGVAALMRELHPDLDSAAIKAIIQNSTVDMQEPLPLSRQGVGRVSVTNAMNLGSYASPGGVSFGRLNPDSQMNIKKTVYVTNFSDHARNFAATHVPNQTLPGVSVNCDAAVGVPANSTKKFKIDISVDPTLLPYDFPSFTQTEVDGWCVLDDGDDTLRVGYMAIVDPASRMAVGKNGKGIRVQNLGGQAIGFADGFTLTGVDGLLLDGVSNAIDAVGYRTADFGAYPVLEMAVVSEVPWESPSNLTWEIYINTDQDPDNIPEVLLLAIDYSAFGGPIGSMITAQFELVNDRRAFLDWFVSSMDYNDRVASLPFTKVLGGGWVTDTFDYTMLVYGRDGSVDIQVGTVDSSEEIVPENSSFGLLGGGSVNLSTNGNGGDMLWLFPNNPTKDQAQIVTIK